MRAIRDTEQLAIWRPRTENDAGAQQDVSYKNALLSGSVHRFRLRARPERQCKTARKIAAAMIARAAQQQKHSRSPISASQISPTESIIQPVSSETVCNTRALRTHVSALVRHTTVFLISNSRNTRTCRLSRTANPRPEHANQAARTAPTKATIEITVAPRSEL